MNWHIWTARNGQLSIKFAADHDIGGDRTQFIGRDGSLESVLYQGAMCASP